MAMSKVRLNWATNSLLIPSIRLNYNHPSSYLSLSSPVYVYVRLGLSRSVSVDVVDKYHTPLPNSPSGHPH